MRTVLTWNVRVLESVHGMRFVSSGTIRYGKRSHILYDVSKRNKEHHQRLRMCVVSSRNIFMESYRGDDVFDVCSRPIRAAVKFDIVRHVSERDQERSER